MDESELIERARQGSEQAWQTIVEQQQEAVFRLAFLLCGDADEAKDVAQDTFIRAFRYLDRFDESRSLRPWLLYMARNVAHNRHRSARRYLAAVQRWLGANLHSNYQVYPVQGRTMDETLIHRWECELLWSALEGMEERDREVIYLRYFLELSVAETAEALHIAQGTVKSRLHRALDRLHGDVLQRNMMTRGETLQSTSEASET